MELRHLRYFVAAAEEQNFNRAAARLRIAQPALSRQIRAMEEEIGCLLFRRLKRGVALSPAGQSFLDDARLLLASLDRACGRALAINRGMTGRLRIGTNAIALGNGSVTGAVNDFRRQCPQVERDLHALTSPEQLDALMGERLDAGLLYLAQPHAGLNSLFVSDYSMLVGMHRDHPLATRAHLRLADLRDEDFLWGDSGPLAFISDEVLRACRAQGLEPHIVQRCSGTDATLGLIAAGVGIGFVHSSIAERPHPQVILRPVDDFQPSYPLALVWPAERELAAFNHFRAMLEARLRGEHGSPPLP